MKVSIAMATHNGAAFIRESLDSILNQTYTDWECVIVDDHSTDDTADVVAEYCRKDLRFKLYVNTTDSGKKYYDAHNKSYMFCQGDYIIRFDDDDIMYTDFIQKMVDFMDSHPEYDAACTLLDEETEGVIASPTALPEEQRVLETYPAYYFIQFGNGVLKLLWRNNGSIIRRTFLEEHPSARFMCFGIGDFVFWRAAASEGCRFGVFNESLMKYRNRKESICHGNELFSHPMTNLEQYYIAYYGYLGLLRVPEDWPDDMTDAICVYRNTVEFFKKKLIDAGQWELVEPDRRY